MEREILFTGIGGQGVQLAAQVLARAAVLEGRHVHAARHLRRHDARRQHRRDARRRRRADLDAADRVARVVARSRCTTSSGRRCAPSCGPARWCVVNRPLFEAELDRRALARVRACRRRRVAAELGSAARRRRWCWSAPSRASRRSSALASLDRGDARSRVPPYRQQHVGAERARAARGLRRGAGRRGARLAARGGRMSAARRSARHRRRSRSSAARAASSASPRARRACCACRQARNALGVPYPELLPGCTGCGACLLVCPDFCFEVFRYETPVRTRRRRDASADGGLGGDRARPRSPPAAASSPAIR